HENRNHTAAHHHQTRAVPVCGSHRHRRRDAGHLVHAVVRHQLRAVAATPPLLALSPYPNVRNSPYAILHPHTLPHRHRRGTCPNPRRTGSPGCRRTGLDTPHPHRPCGFHLGRHPARPPCRHFPPGIP